MAGATTIGPYSIVRLIKQGGQGRVYLGYDRRLRRQVAIKIHRLPRARGERRAMLREARQLALVQDSRVVQVYDVVQSSDYLALVMEYVPGCDLEEMLQTAWPSLASIVSTATDVAAALAAARQQGLVHGDLKAANLLITTEGRIKLTDFGLASSVEESAAADGGGTISALAPEQLAGSSLDVRTDLFALGRLLYRLLTGRDAFTRVGETGVGALLAPEAVSLDRSELLHPESPAELCKLVEQLLRKNPAERPANTHQVRRVLRHVSRQMPLTVGSSLAQEARPVFRPETSADIPLRVPSQLLERGRSRNEQLAFQQRWLSRVPRSASGLLATVLAIAVLLIGAVVALQRAPVSVHISHPVLDIPAGSELAAGVDGPFFAELVGQVLEQHFTEVEFSGALSPRALYVSGVAGPDREPMERIGLTLRCSEAFCLLDLRRNNARGGKARQQLLLNDAPVEHWRSAVRETLLALFP